jgi:beta-glucanase (GH16 family)
MGVHPFGDPAIVDDFEKVRVDFDATELHEYAAEWTPERVTFFVDGETVKTADQSPQYPMQFMLGLYVFGEPAATRRFTVDRFRAYRPRSGTDAP